MKLNALWNTGKQFLDPSRRKVLFAKIRRRWKEGTTPSDSWIVWLQENSVEMRALLDSLDPNLAEESFRVSEEVESEGKRRIEEAEVPIGGAGACPFLYFLTRLTRPGTVIETGVAAGFSSHAILRALQDNGAGTLWSSDFPYFRLSNPEQYIGIAVPEPLKENWNLFIEGDQVNIPQILEKVNQVELVHYDSDKSYEGREWVMERLAPVMEEETIVVMDDIQDNEFFRDWISKGAAPWVVFEYEGRTTTTTTTTYQQIQW